MSQRRFHVATLALLAATTGNLAFAAEKPSDKETKVTQQPRKPTLRLVQAGGVETKAAIPSKTGMVTLKPDLVLTGPVDVNWKWGNVVIDCHWLVKNAGNAVAGVSKLTIVSSGPPSRCMNGQHDKTVPTLSRVVVEILLGLQRELHDQSDTRRAQPGLGVQREQQRVHDRMS